MICKNCGKETANVICDNCGINAYWYNKFGCHKDIYELDLSDYDTEFNNEYDFTQIQDVIDSALDKYFGVI